MDSKDIEAQSIMRKSTHGVRAPRHLTRDSVYISFHSDFFITVCLGGGSLHCKNAAGVH